MNEEEYILGVKESISLLKNGADKAVILKCDTLIAARPERVGAYLVLAQAYVKLNQLGKAELILEKGGDHVSDPELVINLGIVKCKLKKYAEAISLFRSVDSHIKNTRYHFYFAKALFELGTIVEAIDQYKKFIRIDPTHKAALNNLANLLQRNANYSEAINFYKQLIDLYPNEAITYTNLGSVYERLNEIKKASNLYKKSLEINPNLSITYFNFAQLLASGLGDINGALSLIATGLKDGDNLYRDGLRFYQILYRKTIADWSFYEKDQKDLLKIVNDFLDDDTNLPYDIIPYNLSCLLIGNSYYKRVAEKYARRLVKKTQEKYPSISYDHSSSERKIKIGYYSPNFRLHPGGILVRKLFNFHDSSQFEVHAFSLVDTDDFVNKNIKESVDYYHDVSSLNTLEIADLINRSGVDILVALTGYNANMNMEVLALRPAPLQMLMIGSHETSGAPFIDYVFSDQSMMDHSLRENFTEQVITLPCCSLLNSELPFDPLSTSSTKSDYNLPQDKFVYASFNHPRKLDPETLETWMEILKAAPNSVLWLFDGGSSAFRKTILSMADKFNVEEERIIFAPPISIEAHWERIRHADLFLDSFAYNAHFTAVEALRLGVPMISLRGDNHNRRLGASILTYSGLKNCATLTKNDYIGLSILAASNKTKLLSWKEMLQSKESSLLFDTELQVKYLEKAYRKAISIHRKGLPPKDFTVGSAIEMNSI